MLEQSFLRPETIEEAIEILNKYGKEAKILAGGTDLIIGLRENIISCKYLMDIKLIPDMKELKYSEGTGLSIGGAVTVNEIIECKAVQDNYPLLVEAGKALANYLLRNRATMAGNLCNASPAGDMLTPALVLDGVVEAVSVEGTRQIPLKEFFLGVKRTALKENEMVLKIMFPAAKGSGKFQRRSRIKGHDLAQINVAAFIGEQGGLKLALGAVAPVPVLIDSFNTITKASLKEEAVRAQVLDKVLSSINPIGDQRASREYRIAMARYLSEQALISLAEEV